MGKFLTTQDFIYKANKIHKNKYDYSLVKYSDSKNKVKIICPEHGEFEQRPNDHIQGKGCILCAGIKKKNKYEFIKEAIMIHDNKFNYELVYYKDNRTKVKIICLEHGVFEQIPYDHLKGLGCAICGNVKRLTTDEFVKRAKKIHNQYDYSLVDYKNMHTKVKITCLKHGIFKQTPHNHLKFAGCPKCNKSKGEKIISWILEKRGIEYIEQMKFSDCKKTSFLPFDFYLPKYNTCIEFQGIQHYEIIEKMGGENGFDSRQKNDEIKRKYCKNNNIRLLEIKYSDDIILALKNELNINN
jgi:hypothetical protein